MASKKENSESAGEAKETKAKHYMFLFQPTKRIIFFQRKLSLKKLFVPTKRIIFFRRKLTLKKHLVNLYLCK